MKIGHTRLTDGYPIVKEETPSCEVCGVELTVKHIITECLPKIIKALQLNINK